MQEGSKCLCLHIGSRLSMPANSPDACSSVAFTRFKACKVIIAAFSGRSCLQFGGDLSRADSGPHIDVQLMMLITIRTVCVYGDVSRLWTYWRQAQLAASDPRRSR